MSSWTRPERLNLATGSRPLAAHERQCGSDRLVRFAAAQWLLGGGGACQARVACHHRAAGGPEQSCAGGGRVVSPNDRAGNLWVMSYAACCRFAMAIGVAGARGMRRGVLVRAGGRLAAARGHGRARLRIRSAQVRSGPRPGNQSRRRAARQERSAGRRRGAVARAFAVAGCQRASSTVGRRRCQVAVRSPWERKSSVQRLVENVEGLVLATKSSRTSMKRSGSSSWGRWPASLKISS